MNNLPPIDWTAAARWRLLSFAIGVVTLVVCAALAVFWPVPFFQAYLAAYLFYLGIALGSMVLMMAHQLTGGSWGLLIRRILEAAMKTLPLLALLFVPIAAGVGYIYVWAQPAEVAASPKLQYQQFYLQPAYFWLRATVYFVLWLGIAYLLGRWSRRQDETGEPRLAWKLLKFSGFGAVLYGVSFHFAAVDWAMSVHPTFHSTIWGPMFAAGQLLSALSFAIVVLPRLIDRPPLAEVASLQVRNDLGSLLLTFTILWAYMVFFQFMLVWIANMPVDVVWYVPLRGPRLADRDRRGCPVQLCGSVLPAGDAADQAEQPGDGLDRRIDPPHAIAVHVLRHSTGAGGRRRGRVSLRAGGFDRTGRPLVRRFLVAVAVAAALAAARLQPGGRLAPAASRCGRGDAGGDRLWLRRRRTRT